MCSQSALSQYTKKRDSFRSSPAFRNCAANAFQPGDPMKKSSFPNCRHLCFVELLFAPHPRFSYPITWLPQINSFTEQRKTWHAFFASRIKKVASERQRQPSICPAPWQSQPTRRSLLIWTRSAMQPAVWGTNPPIATLY